ncbi:MAG: hypothetical protein HOH77_22950 [Candidatus Latescibacteria bacterium]|nr:hypothetical protein [Candidatus Latescibacterota bacterium]
MQRLSECEAGDSRFGWLGSWAGGGVLSVRAGARRCSGESGHRAGVTGRCHPQVQTPEAAYPPRSEQPSRADDSSSRSSAQDRNPLRRRALRKRHREKRIPSGSSSLPK